jgi:phage/plasmid-associated DNA primase
MSNYFHNFILENGNYESDSPKYTIYSNGQKNFNLSKYQIQDFWVQYCTFSSNNRDENLNIAEIPSVDDNPLMCQCTFSFDSTYIEDVGEPYEDNLIYLMIYCYQQAMREYLSLSNSARETFCVYLESDIYENIHTSKHLVDLRLQFPYCRVTPEAGTIIRSRAIELIKKYINICRLDRDVHMNWDSIISKDFSAPVLLYGSTKEIGKPHLELQGLYHAIPDQILSQNSVSINGTSVDIFNIQDHRDVQSGLVITSSLDGLSSNDMLPIFLSLNFHSKLTMLKERRNDVKHNQPVVINMPTNIEEDELSRSKRLARMINPARFSNDKFLSEIGTCFYNITNGKSSGLNAWLEITHNHTKRDSTDMKIDYEYFTGSALSWKTIAWYASLDNSKIYNDWHTKWYRSALKLAISSTHTDVAEAVWRVYFLKYVCYDIKKNLWARFVNHGWANDDDGSSLRVSLKVDFKMLVEKYRTQISSKIQETKDESDKEKLEIAVKKAGKLIEHLKNRTYKGHIMAEARDNFYYKDYMEKLDSNIELIRVINGVLEVNGNNIVMRKGTPEDYLSKCAATKFNNSYTWESEDVKAIMKWVGQIHVEEPMRDYFLKFNASLLRGRNSDKIFPAFSGANGQNSKSMWVKALMLALGTYIVKFPISELTTKRGPGGAASPQLARTENTRGAIAEEPDDEEGMKKGIIKQFTGGDSFFARFLNDNGGEVEATFKLILVCNKIPSMDSGEAIKERLRVFPFLSTWVTNPPEDIKEQYKRRLFKRDTHFGNRLPRLAGALLWVLVKYYPKYKAEGLEPPKVVLEYTKEYWLKNDIYHQFKEECIEKAMTMDEKTGITKIDKTATLSIMQIYGEFTLWYNESGFDKKNRPDKIIMGENLKSRWGRTTNSAWAGLKFKESVANI